MQMKHSSNTTGIWREFFAFLVVIVHMSFVFPATAQNLQTQKGENLSALDNVNQEIAVSKKKKVALRQEIALLNQDKAQISQALIDTAKRTRKLEIRLGEIETRLAALSEQEAGIKRSLHERRYLLSQVLAALQRMGRQPPPALLVRPEDALASVRSAVLLGAVIPEMRAETDILIADLRELMRLRSDMTVERKQHAISIKSLAEDDIRLSLLVDEKLKLQGKTRQALKSQGEEARKLAEKATSLKQLIASLSAQINDVELAARVAREADEARQKAEDKRLSIARGRISSNTSSKNSRLAGIKPLLSFEEAKGRLQLPVSGVEVLSFGQKNTSGTRAKGVLMATRANALVISPLDAKVVYAGPFRSYGQLLILDAGNHVHIVLAGMSRINVGAGQIVLAGEPVAKMGSTRIASVAVVDIASSRPMLYVEFRKSGKSFDPSPWWAENSMKRPRNDS
jgi:septal ring factor EnvC (AmiA/AmiB activator)